LLTQATKLVEDIFTYRQFMGKQEVSHSYGRSHMLKMTEKESEEIFNRLIIFDTIAIYFPEIEDIYENYAETVTKCNDYYVEFGKKLGSFIGYKPTEEENIRYEDMIRKYKEAESNLLDSITNSLKEYRKQLN